MRELTVKKTYKTFEELTKEEQKKQIEKNRDINTDHGWSDFLVGDFKDKLKKLGFYEIKVYWSGFNSQGDGACFEAKHNRGSIVHSGRYYHEYTMQCDCNVVLMVARRLAKKFYIGLESTYDYLTSDEAIKESLIRNGVEFLDCEDII